MIKLFENFESQNTLEHIVEEEFGIGPGRLEGVLISTETYSVSVLGMVFAYIGKQPKYTWTERLESFKYKGGEITRMNNKGKKEGYVYQPVIWLYINKYKNGRENYNDGMYREFNSLFEDYDVPYYIKWDDINTSDNNDYDVLVLLPRKES